MSGPAERKAQGPISILFGGTRCGMVELNGTEGLVEDDPIDVSEGSKRYGV